MVDVNFDIGRVYVHLPVHEWNEQDAVEVYGRYKEAFSIAADDDARFMELWRHRAGALTHVPVAGAKLVIAPYRKDQVELIGASPALQEQQERLFYELVASYFMHRNESPRESRTQHLQRRGETLLEQLILQ